MGQVDACWGIVLLLSTYYVCSCVVGDFVDNVIYYCSKEESSNNEQELLD